MSVWTHVLGSIRIDALEGITPPFYLYEVAIPQGSEGPLKLSLWQSGRASQMARYSLTVFGDLRDYDDEEEIIQYFYDLIKDKLIRSAFFTFNVEGRSPRHFVWDGELDDFIELEVP